MHLVDFDDGRDAFGSVLGTVGLQDGGNDRIGVHVVDGTGGPFKNDYFVFLEDGDRVIDLQDQLSPEFLEVRNELGVARYLVQVEVEYL